MWLFNFIKSKKNIQQETNPNRAVMFCMQENGFSAIKIRKALIEANDVNIVDLANGDMSPSTIYKTLRGRVHNEEAMSRLANSLGLGIGELFPE